MTFPATTFEQAMIGLRETPLSTAIRESDWIFPSIESAHVIAFVVVVGSIAVVDLRLVGLASRGRRADQLTRELLPLTWAAFVLAAAAGLLLFIAKPVTYTSNGFFLSKMVLLLLAGLNMAAFHLFVHGRLIGVPAGAPEPVGARICGWLSLALWIGIVACGRWIGFTTVG
jgi:hypothetical protein